ncbi:methyltransferase domain-containing protein [Pseudonocardia humida]|uniref:Methyltransferase domain-containing protein n=1 Tax=Pseudonocardia humida TaxID=2800819 RepID=A0ABT1ADD2_9PSEU|nr:methyltransferase domain-containing protein [Pseudonocardia humida]MCO1661065.1 methyltransferase domain-containing protein [Pseudonocardia humida]
MRRHRRRDVLISSRSLAEYRAMFGLSDADLTGAVLDCAAGGSSFVAELGPGADAVAVDPAYARPDVELAAALAGDTRRCADIAVEHADEFVWDWYRTPRRRDRMRAVAAARFLDDKAARPERYRAGSLPDLPFPDSGFDLVLCSHLLFTWADPLDLQWHANAVDELLRVARGEVRLYPLVRRGAGEAVPFLPALREHVRARGHRWSEEVVDFRFQRRAGVMARLVKGHLPAV